METNNKEAKESWEVQKGQLIQRFEILTNNDLTFEEGKKDEMFGRLQIILGYSKDQLKEIISKIS
jgi:uncharacterized protein YjbJ (UPF0337 family)